MPRSLKGTRSRVSAENHVLACATCGGRLRFLATIEDAATVTKILTHLGLRTERPVPFPARAPPQPNEFDFP